MGGKMDNRLKSGGGSLGKLYDTPVKAIRKKCLDCCCGQFKEVRYCVVKNCALYAYRFGHRPDESTLHTINEFYNEKL